MNKKKYWYKTYVGECPICGSDKTYEEKVMGEKPSDPELWYDYISNELTYDYCDM